MADTKSPAPKTAPPQTSQQPPAKPTGPVPAKSTAAPSPPAAAPDHEPASPVETKPATSAPASGQVTLRMTHGSYVDGNEVTKTGGLITVSADEAAKLVKLGVAERA